MANGISVTDFVSGFSAVLKRVLNHGETYCIVKYGTPVATFGPASLSNQSDSVTAAIEIAKELREDCVRSHNMKGAEALEYFIDLYKERTGLI